MNPPIAPVVETCLCTGCGTCVGICPTEALAMTETPGGLMVPRADFARCTACGRCETVCPQMRISGRLESHLADPFVGPVQKAFLGQATDPSAAAAGQTGGLGRALLAWALESGWADQAVCVMPDPDRPLHPAAVLTSNPADVLSSCRSKYCPIPVNTLLRRIRGGGQRVAYLGLGCHLQGLALALEHYPDLQERIVLKIGLFCDRVLSYRAVDFLIRCAGLSTPQAAAFDYRDKTWRGWPGDTRITDHRGQVHYLSRAYRTGCREFFTPLACRLCIDKLNALADVSLGDPYGLARGARVPTAAIARTPLGLSCLMEAHREGRVNLSPADPKRILDHQNIHSRVRNAVCVARPLVAGNRLVPAALRTAPLTVTSKGPRPLRARWAVWAATRLATASATAYLRRLPRWLPRLCNAVERAGRRANILRNRICPRR